MYRIRVLLLTLTTVVSAVVASSVYAAFTIFSVSLAVPDVLCNIKTGVATGVGAGTCASSIAACDGVTDDSVAFTSFNSWAVGTWQASHTGLIGITWSGTCVITGNTIACGTSSNFKCPFSNIKNLVVIGIGSAGITGNYVSLAGSGLVQDNAHSARTTTAVFGDTCVTLSDPTKAALFTANNYAIMTGFDLQGLWNIPFGFPPNLHYFDYVLVSSVSSTLNCDGTNGASVSFLTTPLTNAYKSTWPNYNTGNNFEIDAGGPATLYYLDPSWNTTVEFRNLTIERPGNQIYAIGKSVIYRNSIFTGSLCAVPTQNQTWQAIGSYFSSCNLEVDKLVGSMVISGGSQHIIQVQSSSVNLLSVSNSTVDQLQGTPKNFVGIDSTFTLFRPGAFAYGRSDSSVCTRCIINSISMNGVADTGRGAGITNFYAMNSGVISYPNGTTVLAVANNGSGKPRLTVFSTVGFATGAAANISNTCMVSINGTSGSITVVDGTHIDLLSATLGTVCATPQGYVSNTAPQWAVPGTNVFWTGPAGFETLFRIVDVTQDATNTYIQTNLAGGFPSVAGLSGLRVHSAPKFTCPGCTGSDTSIASLAVAPVNAPLYSYQTYTFTGLVGAVVQPKFTMLGNLSSLSINVTNAYVGAGALSFNVSQFNNWPILKFDGTFSNYAPIVNAKISGNRAITLSGVSGTQSGDSGLVVPDAVQSWFVDQSNSGSIYSADVSGVCPGVNCPSVTITIQTDQGVVNP